MQSWEGKAAGRLPDNKSNSAPYRTIARCTPLEPFAKPPALQLLACPVPDAPQRTARRHVSPRSPLFPPRIVSRCMRRAPHAAVCALFAGPVRRHRPQKPLHAAKDGRAWQSALLVRKGGPAGTLRTRENPAAAAPRPSRKTARGKEFQHISPCFNLIYITIRGLLPRRAFYGIFFAKKSRKCRKEEPRNG